MKTKYEHVADDLREKFTRMASGSKLPPIRNLIRDYSVSQFTVDKALDILEEEGVVVRRAALGVFTARPGQNRTQGEVKRLLILAQDLGDMEFLNVIRNTACERGYLPRIHYFDFRDPPQRWIPKRRYDGALFLGSCPTEAIPVVTSRKYPIVFQGTKYAHQNVDCTCGDERMAGAMAANHLIELGHRRVAVLVNEPHCPDVEERVRGFVNQAQLAGGVQVSVLDCNTSIHEDSREAARTFFLKRMQEGTLDFTGLFTVSDAGAIPVLQVCYENGISIPGTLSVIGCDNKSDVKYLCPALTTMEYSYTDRANGLIDILEKRLEGDDSPGICKVYLPRIILRNSTARPGKE